MAALRHRSYRVIGPTIRDGAIVYDDVASLADLPRGWTDEQDGGTYRLRRRDDDALFGYAVGPHSWKQFLFPPHTLLTRIRRTDDGGLQVSDGSDEEAPRLAFLAARACALHAVAVQDKVFLQRGAQDPTYATRRENAFIVAANCGEPSGTCFCVSMGTGPRAEAGFDLALTELLDDRVEAYWVGSGLLDRVDAAVLCRYVEDRFRAYAGPRLPHLTAAALRGAVPP